MKLRILHGLLIILLLTGCDNDDNGSNNIVLNQQGTVLTETSCNTEGNGLAYTIDVDNLENVEFIITASLSNQFKQEGLRIEFDMEPSSEGIGACTANFLPEQFYKITNIKIIDNGN